MKLYTKNGRRISIPKTTKEHMAAHSDVDMSVVKEAVSKIDYNGGLFIDAIDLGRVVGMTHCVEVGPDDEVLHLYRKNRKGTTPFVKGRDPKETTKVVVCIKPGWRGGNILITSYYGDRAPMEPWDARRKQCSQEEIDICDEFWSKHALIFDPEMIDMERSSL